MKKVLSAFVVGALVATGLFGSLSYHFIRTRDGLVVERKSEFTFTDTFVDTRAWGLTDYVKHPRIGGILLKRRLQGAADSAADALEKGKKALDDGLEKVQEKLR
jgi:hypothetical protein